MNSLNTRNLLKDNAGLLELIQRFIDPLLIVGSGVALYAINFGDLDFPRNYVFVLTGSFMLCMAVFPFFNIYRPYRGISLWAETQVLASAWALMLACLAMVLFMTKTSTDFSRLWIGQWAIAGFLSLLVFRILLRSVLRFLRHHGYNLRFVAIAGAGDLGRDVARRLAASPWTGLKVMGFYDDDPRLQRQTFDGVPVRGGLHRLPHEVAEFGIDQVWIALPLHHDKQVKSLVSTLSRTPVQVTFVPDIYGVQLLNHSIGEVAGFPVIHLMESPLSGVKGLIKIVEDRLLAALILLAAAPLMLLIAVGVKLSSPGPLFFGQLRGGLHGERIWVWKFRTMKHHVESAGKVTQAMPGDSRVTAFGAFLRRTSLDELPQFFNVLKGDMSIVGPRPHAVEHDEFYQRQIDAYMLRHHVKPGITGWAQINGWRGETGELEKMEMRIRHDLYYINNWSLWFDLRIIFMTVFMMITGKNAY
ncbi:MAG: undecaprenyl-phosphate glucose phosphotransferase [Gallionellales bacterium RIFCSPLOWO2_12_FULL_59_22]|nr:MAG: undecaprenyl-phosphate glucose phosphotransferase [Gallionellales bacterium RIFCSPLOWO2_02_58_13]OGT14394.1 MAG: undecaprenyl-phosphate glucose phosphotransferase [Gallionellales bacterium RIFCSPLOWO2_12_FULL_59_22]